MLGNTRHNEDPSTQSNDRKAQEGQLALERRALAELLLDIYESGLQRNRGALDPQRPDSTMKERS